MNTGITNYVFSVGHQSPGFSPQCAALLLLLVLVVVVWWWWRGVPAESVPSQTQHRPHRHPGHCKHGVSIISAITTHIHTYPHISTLYTAVSAGVTSETTENTRE